MRRTIRFAAVLGLAPFLLVSQSAGRAQSTSCLPPRPGYPGVELCLPPQRVADAESRLQHPPLRPVTTVTRVTQLPFTQTAILTTEVAPGGTPITYFIAYLFGNIARASDGSLQPSSPNPRFMLVGESAGHVQKGETHTLNRGLGALQYFRIAPGSPLPWELDRQLPNHSYVLHIVSNLPRDVVKRVTREIIVKAASSGSRESR